MALRDDLLRLSYDLQMQRTDLQQLMDDSDLSRRTTEELRQQIARLRGRIEAIAELESKHASR